eukprot:TRINITY_DN103561_c0_g1_i1.p1 TRINITY_DN103561_c0_g1~~TRINITY_DN103561_c0_g1_i1.p1  ORF type:complete len:393 (+),score=115.38 TRINITY_DN103561_c0_g1_i1:218-1396(+)
MASLTFAAGVPGATPSQALRGATVGAQSVSPVVLPGFQVLDASSTSAASSSGSGACLAAAGCAVGAVATAVASSRRREGAARNARRSAKRVVAMKGGVVCAGVVITGGAAGVGYAYAEEFLKRGHRVVINDVKDPTEAVNALKEKFPEEGVIYGKACDVSDINSVNEFADFVKEKIGVVHYWINNAGINGGRRKFTELSTEEVNRVVNVNLGGIVMCTHVAMKMMEQQAGVTGHVFNTVGSGVKGGGTPGYVAYGATKRGLPQMTDSLVRELDDGVEGYDLPETPGKVMVHTLSPGMVFTDLLLNDSTPKLRKFPFGVLAALPEEVAEDVVPKILGVSKNGSSVEYLDTPKILSKFFDRFIMGKKSEYIDDDGNVIKRSDREYLDNGVAKQY